MDQRVSVITLGVTDVGRSQAFYGELGWHLDDGIDDDKDHIAFFQAPGMIVSLWDRAKLAEDGGITDPGGWGGVTIGHCVGSPRGGRPDPGRRAGRRGDDLEPRA
jgi:uncharacterized protein